MKLNNIAKLVISIGLCELAGVVGSIFTVSAIPQWYAGLIKPALSPPAWIFAPAWITLYALMGLAVFWVWRVGAENKKVRKALIIFDAQLFLNVLWSIIFFGLKSPGGALIDIIVLWFLIVATIIAFAKISKSTVWLLAPYLVWVSFAVYLNYSIWALN